MKIDDAHRDHIQAVQEWLEKNVRVYPTPSRISLRQIQLDSNTLRGEALLFVGDTLPGEALTLRMGDAGWPKHFFLSNSVLVRTCTNYGGLHIATGSQITRRRLAGKTSRLFHHTCAAGWELVAVTKSPSHSGT